MVNLFFIVNLMLQEISCQNFYSSLILHDFLTISQTICHQLSVEKSLFLYIK